MAVVFLDVLRNHLRALESQSGTPAYAMGPAFDLPAARRHFLEAAEAVERATEASERAAAGRKKEKSAARASLSHDSGWGWLLRERCELDAFLQLIASELSLGLCAGAGMETLQAHIHQAVDVVLGLPSNGLSRVRESELMRVAECAIEAVEGGGVEDIARYALEIRAVRSVASGFAVSNIGSVLLGLPETDAIRWLLTVEVLQSTGRRDEWRTPREALFAILRWPEGGFSELCPIGEDDEDGMEVGGEPWLFSVAVLSRLKGLGVVSSTRGSFWRCSLSRAFRPMLEEVASQHSTPLSTLAESLIAEERGIVFDRVEGKTPREPAVEIQARHARMVVHEIRNALVPVRMALTGVYRTLDAHSPAGGWRAQKERIDRGLDRVFRFVGELQKITLLTTALVEPFDIVAAIQDAITGANGGIALELQLPAIGALPRLVGHRERFTLAIVNILRNAAQNNPRPRPRVRLSAASMSGGRVVVTVDDDGVGVPEEHRERIFQQGFAMRQGGSGQGLAMVREVVEAEMKGEVRCEQGDLGGARFILVLPTPAKESP